MKIQVKDLNITFGKKHILKNISVDIPEKKITAIIGQSGCGKSTFLKSLNRIIEEEGGSVGGNILYDEKNIWMIPKEELRKKIGLVFQQPVTFPYSIEKNISYVLNYHFRLNKKELSERVKHYLKEVKLYEEVEGQMGMLASRLSGGQQQRLSVARSLCVEPEVVLLDEPCSALDMKNTSSIEEMLVELKNQYTIIIVTHNLAQAKRIADKVIFMDKGKVIEDSEKKSFFEEPKSDLAKAYIQYM